MDMHAHFGSGLDLLHRNVSPHRTYTNVPEGGTVYCLSEARCVGVSINISRQIIGHCGLAIKLWSMLSTWLICTHRMRLKHTCRHVTYSSNIDPAQPVLSNGVIAVCNTDRCKHSKYDN